MSRVEETDIISDIPLEATFTRSDVKNSWGIAVDRDNSIWFTNNGSNTLLHIRGSGKIIGSAISTPSHPTGIVLNRCDTSFRFTRGLLTRSAKVIMVTEDGAIAAYNSEVDLNNAVIVKQYDGKVFTGVTRIKDTLYIANFRSGFVEMYDKNFEFRGQFTDPGLNARKYAPYNVYAFRKEIYVAWAKHNGGDEVQSPDRREVTGTGNGYIDVFSSVGNLNRRLTNRGHLNTPWGMISTRTNDNSDALAVSNFGDGRINFYERDLGDYLGSMYDSARDQLRIDGVRGLDNRNDDIWFVGGINNEDDGLIGRLRPL